MFVSCHFLSTHTPIHIRTVLSIGRDFVNTVVCALPIPVPGTYQALQKHLLNKWICLNLNLPFHWASLFISCRQYKIILWFWCVYIWSPSPLEAPWGVGPILYYLPQSLSMLLIQIGPEFEFRLSHLLSFVKYGNFTKPWFLHLLRAKMTLLWG